MTGGLSWWHWLIIIAAFILIFGAKKLPDAARGVGRSLRILKSEVAAMHEDDDKSGKATDASAETDASARAATPPAEISASPMEQPAQQSQQPAAAQATPQPAAQQPAQQASGQAQQVPVVNGTPTKSDQQ